MNDFEPEIILKNAANFLRSSLINSYSEGERLSWPPTVEELTEKRSNSPMIFLKFLCDLIIGKPSQ